MTDPWLDLAKAITRATFQPLTPKPAPPADYCGTCLDDWQDHDGYGCLRPGCGCTAFVDPPPPMGGTRITWDDARRISADGP